MSQTHKKRKKKCFHPTTTIFFCILLRIICTQYSRFPNWWMKFFRHCAHFTILLNKYFFQASKRYLWRKIQLKHVALDLLGTNRRVPGLCSPYEIKNCPTHQTWRRFFEYTKYVKDLTGGSWDTVALENATRFRPHSTQGLDIETLDYFFPEFRLILWVRDE